MNKIIIKQMFDYQDKIMIPIAIGFALFMFYISSISTEWHYQIGSAITGVLTLYFMIITYIHIYKFRTGNYKYRWYLP